MSGTKIDAACEAVRELGLDAPLTQLRKDAQKRFGAKIHDSTIYAARTKVGRELDAHQNNGTGNDPTPVAPKGQVAKVVGMVRELLQHISKEEAHELIDLL